MTDDTDPRPPEPAPRTSTTEPTEPKRRLFVSFTPGGMPKPARADAGRPLGFPEGKAPYTAV